MSFLPFLPAHSPLPPIHQSAALRPLPFMSPLAAEHGGLNGTADTELVQQGVESVDRLEESGYEYMFVLPFIALFGLCGNIVSLVAILHSRLRKMAANQYLVVLTIADSFFLVGIILVLFKVDFVGFVPCVLVEYLLMTSSYVSSWSIAALTLERYLAIAHPLKHVQYGHFSRWKAMACWLPVPFLLNLVQFVTLSPNELDQPLRKCVLRDGRLQLITELFDVLLCYLLPCCIVVVLNLVIASKVRSSDRHFSSSAGSSHLLKKPPNSNAGSQHSSAKCSTNSEQQPPNRKCSSRTMAVPPPSISRTAGGSVPSNAGSTRILFVVPIVYILLNTPFYLFRILDTVALNLFHSHLFQGDGLSRKPVLAWLYNLSHYLFYVNFACDVLVYAFSSANFRRTVVIAWTRLLCPGWTLNKRRQEMPTRCTLNGNSQGGGGANGGHQPSMRGLLTGSASQLTIGRMGPAQSVPKKNSQQQKVVSLEVDGDEARRALTAEESASSN